MASLKDCSPQRWLMKSEPSVYPWSKLVSEKRTSWNGVRNYLANNNMKAMKLGDEAFFYHSNEQLSIVGIMKVVALWRLDPEDTKGIFGMVDVAPVSTFQNPVTLSLIKSHPRLQEMLLVKQGRLSVSPVQKREWEEIILLGCPEPLRREK